MLQTIGLRMRSHRSVRDYPFVKTICGGRTERVVNERIAVDIRQQTSAQTSSPSDEHEKRRNDPAYQWNRRLDPRVLNRIVELAHVVHLRVSVQYAAAGRPDLAAAEEV